MSHALYVLRIWITQILLRWACNKLNCFGDTSTFIELQFCCQMSYFTLKPLLKWQTIFVHVQHYGYYYPAWAHGNCTANTHRNTFFLTEVQAMQFSKNERCFCEFEDHGRICNHTSGHNACSWVGYVHIQLRHFECILQSRIPKIVNIHTTPQISSLSFVGCPIHIFEWIAFLSNECSHLMEWSRIQNTGSRVLASSPATRPGAGCGHAESMFQEPMSIQQNDIRWKPGMQLYSSPYHSQWLCCWLACQSSRMI